MAARFRLGVVEQPGEGHEHAVGRLAIPYLTPTGPVSIKFRCMKHTKCEGHAKYLAPQGQENHIFNVNAFFADSDRIAVCEGEMDAIAMDGVVGIPAVAIPGASNWEDYWPRLFTGFAEVLVYADADRAGQGMAQRIVSHVPRARQVALPDSMDVNEVLIRHGKEWFK